MATLVSETPVKSAQGAEFSTETQQKSEEFNWVFFVTIALFHLLALAAIVQSAFHWRWSSVVVFLAVWLVGQNVGIGMSYHRQLTHRGYATPKWLEYFMAGCGTMALQGGPLYWVAVHRMHHQYTDKPGDPHSPRDGAWWSHMGWILNGSLHNESKVLSRYAPDLAKDPVHQWLSKYHWVPVTTVGFGLLFGGAAFGGWGCGISWVLWGIFLRVTVGMHVTWLVNSATHMWGSRRSNPRRLHQQLGYRTDHWRRRVAQQPPRTSSICAARHGVVRRWTSTTWASGCCSCSGLAKNVHALNAKTALAKSQLR